MRRASRRLQRVDINSLDDSSSKRALAIGGFVGLAAGITFLVLDGYRSRTEPGSAVRIGRGTIDLSALTERALTS